MILACFFKGIHAIVKRKLSFFIEMGEDLSESMKLCLSGYFLPCFMKGHNGSHAKNLALNCLY